MTVEDGVDHRHRAHQTFELNQTDTEGNGTTVDIDEFGSSRMSTRSCSKGCRWGMRYLR